MGTVRPLQKLRGESKNQYPRFNRVLSKFLLTGDTKPYCCCLGSKVGYVCPSLQHHSCPVWALPETSPSSTVLLLTCAARIVRIFPTDSTIPVNTNTTNCWCQNDAKSRNTKYNIRFCSCYTLVWNPATNPTSTNSSYV